MINSSMMLVFKFQLMHSKKIVLTLRGRMGRLGSNNDRTYMTATHQAEWNENPRLFISMLQFAKMGAF
jgi:hypothetical protein